MNQIELIKNEYYGVKASYTHKEIIEGFFSSFNVAIEYKGKIKEIKLYVKQTHELEQKLKEACYFFRIEIESKERR